MSADAKVMVACLIAASTVAVWAVRDSTRLLNLPWLVLLACTYIVLAAVAAGVVFFVLRRGARPFCLRHVFFSCVGSAALLPGALLLLKQQSVFATVPVAAIAWLVASALRTHQEKPEEPGGLMPRMSPLAPVTGGLAQLAVAMTAAQEMTLAAAAAGAGMLTLMAVPGVVPFVERSRRCSEIGGMERRWLLVFANAFTVTCFALLPHVWWGSRVPATQIPESIAPEESRARQVNSEAPVDDDVHQGIIIYPEEEQHTVLVPPMPAVRAMGRGRALDSLSIPFFGVYWLYRPPYNRPPPKSLVLRADPAKRNLYSNDGRSLKMEARQNFGAYFDPACCTAVSVVGVNADPSPGGVMVEVLVRDSADEKRAPSFVGRLPLGMPGEMNLRFELPVGLTRFDEVVVYFRLPPWRRDKAAKVSISRFVFAPAGR